MSGKVSRLLLSASLLAVLAGCNSLGFGGDKKDPAPAVTVASPEGQGGPIAGAETIAPPTNGPVYLSGKCPEIVIRDDGAVHKVYAKGAKDDAQQLIYQASLIQGTRQCTTDGTAMTMTVVVQGRLVAGPAAGAGVGPVSLPIKVAVQDDKTVLYSDTTNFTPQLPPGQTSGQFLYTDNKVRVTSGAAGFVSVYVSFDDAAPAAAKPVRTGHRKK